MRQNSLKCVIFLSLFLTSLTAFPGDWVAIEVPDPSSSAVGETFYVDPDLGRRGRSSVIHTLRNYRERNGRGHASESMVCEFNCNHKLIRAIAGAFYSDPMGKGKEERWNARTPWVRPTPGSALERVLNYACTHYDDAPDASEE